MSYIDQFQPPYFLLLAGLLISLTSGAAFSQVLKQTVNDWYEKRSTRSLAKLQGIDVQLPFLGICMGICIFLASGLSIFGFSGWVSYGFSLPLTLLSAGLIWTQLKSNLAILEGGNARAFELDIF
ncbi:hypothetical protein IQ241_24670 [Romeria aff. gracilis LEGE 07310]|uniref:Uncharacterized protein n=1 Tax=Vasconcelosia minhoensis LEGE 07310 TaxID=915328 RepID=A0A8J7ACB8_9CYAN|nr:hypothetical protein [Romeria gracilis]MBE9080440.1 hypothetical protein [Romeria aff. gracilis LEGE 07310]